jgi:hypothetical protein
MCIFIKKIQKIIKYIPIIWDNWYDNDFNTSINIFKFELENIANHLESTSDLDIDKHNASRIRLVIKLLNKSYGDEPYLYDVFDELERKYGKSNIDFVLIDSSGDKLYTMVETLENELSEVEEANYHNDKAKMLDTACKKDIKAKKLVWRIIEQDIQSWWS